MVITAKEEISGLILTCPHCKHTGADVHYHWVYVGGIGDIRVIGCDDAVACWWRWDKNNGVKDET